MVMSGSDNWTACASQLRVGLYIHVFPYANQGRRGIWNGLDRNGKKFLSAFPDELVESRSDLKMRLILKNGSIYQLLGADDPDKLVGINCIGAVFSDVALMDPQALRLVQPILYENGGWAIFPSTPRGRNHFYRLRVVESDVKEVKGMVKQIHDRQLLIQPCSRPNLCVNIEPRVAELEKLVEQGKGARAVVSILYLVFGAGIASAIRRYFGK